LDAALAMEWGVSASTAAVLREIGLSLAPVPAGRASSEGSNGGLPSPFEQQPLAAHNSSFASAAPFSSPSLYRRTFSQSGLPSEAYRPGYFAATYGAAF
jgi:hypothetical protein